MSLAYDSSTGWQEHAIGAATAQAVMHGWRGRIAPYSRGENDSDELPLDHQPDPPRLTDDADRTTSAASTGADHSDAPLRGAGISRASDITAFSSHHWQPKAAQRLVDLLRLPIGWDGHQGRPVSPLIADYAFKLLQDLMLRPGLPVPSITPLAYGGIMLEWHRLGWDVEIEIDAPTSHHVYTCQIASQTEEQFPLGPRLERLSHIMAHIADAD